MTQHEPSKRSTRTDDAHWRPATLDDAGFAGSSVGSKDMVIRGGENIYPREIEEFLPQAPGHPGRAGDWRADEKYGEKTLCLDRAARRSQARRGCRACVLP